MTASLLIIPVARFFDASGKPLSGGKVYTYAAGTNTPKASYTDFNGNVANTNPVILDSSGQANIWLNGNYKINLLDANNVQQPNYPVDGVSSFSASSNFFITTGIANAYILTPSPSLLAYAAGDEYNVEFNIANSGPSTINISGLGVKNLVVGPTTPLTSGNLATGIVYKIIYDGTNFQVLNPTTIASSPPILITMGLSANAPSGNLVINGDSIGSAASGATHASSVYANVYAYWWNNVSDTYAPVTSGRGSTAAADFAANKPLTMPTWANRSPYGVGATLNAPAVTGGAGTVTSTGSIAVTMSSITLSSGQIPTPSSNSMPGDAANNTGTNAVTRATTPGGAATTLSGLITLGYGGGSFTPSVASQTYTGNATSVIHPIFGIYYYISY